MLKPRIYYIIQAVYFFLLLGCANVVPPGGGPKDINPPVVLYAEPVDKSLNFKQDEVKIFFNEFVELKDLSSQLFISPPLDEAPEVRIKGKSIIVNLPDSLHENTTYTIYFGSAIRDITENNILRDFTYSFSTGPTRDSLQLEGSVVDAYTSEAVKDALICVYNERTDSLFTTRRPDYITRSGEDGSFTVYNLPFRKFWVYALQDANNNIYYDLPNEAIAFDTNFFYPEIPQQKPDTSTDSVITPAIVDTVLVDTLIDEKQKIAASNPLQPYLRLFTDRDTSQKILKTDRPNAGQIRFVFNQSVQQLNLRPLDTILDPGWAIVLPNRIRDTINLWLNVKLGDSLVLEVSDAQRFKDTLTFSLRETRVNRPSKKKSITPATASRGFKLESNLTRSFNLHYTPSVWSKYPIDSLVASKVELYNLSDSISLNPAPEISGAHKAEITQGLAASKSYRIVFHDSAIIDIRGVASDSTAYTIKTLNQDELGILRFSLSGLDSLYWIAELLEGDKLVRRSEGRDNAEINYQMLAASKYRLRLIIDRNHNHRWDPGFYPAFLQPESVYYFPKELNVRAKWEQKEVWDVSKP